MSRPTKILYVEDEPFLGKIVYESLISRDLDVKMVTDGLDVLPTLQRFGPDLLILDVMLPNKDGFTIGKEVNQLYPELPIIYLTAKDQTEDILTGFQSGGNDYIRKPFSLEELIARIQNLLALTGTKEKENIVRQHYQIGGMDYHPSKLEVTIAGDSRLLSHRENELLHLLISKPNQTIERKDILMRIWGDDSIFNSRNLDVYIRKLRKMLEPVTQVQIITLKGIGYHFRIDN